MDSSYPVIRYPVICYPMIFILRIFNVSVPESSSGQAILNLIQDLIVLVK